MPVVLSSGMPSAQRRLLIGAQERGAGHSLAKAAAQTSSLFLGPAEKSSFDG